MRFWHPDPKISVEFETLVDSIPYDSTLDTTLFESRYCEIHTAFVNEWLRTEEDNLFQLQDEGIGGAAQQARAKTVYCQKCGGRSFHFGLSRDFIGTEQVVAKCVVCEFEITIGVSSLAKRKGSDVADQVDDDITSDDDEMHNEVRDLQDECIKESAATEIETHKRAEIPNSMRHLRGVLVLQRLLWKIVPPFEVKVTSDEIRRFLDKHAFLCRDIIERDALALVRGAPEKVVYSVRIDGLKPDRLALILITNVLGEHISGGKYHVYRGFLGMVGDDMLTVWNAAITALRLKGYYTENEAAEDYKWIRERIKNAG